MSLADVSLHLVDNVDEAYRFINWLREVGTRRENIGIDTETTGLSHETDYVRLCQIGDDMTGWAIPFERWGGVVSDALRLWQGDWVLHNAPFDVGMLDKEDPEFQLPRGRIKDTRPMCHVLDSRQSTALKNVAGRLVDPVAAAMQGDLSDAIGKAGGWTWATVPIHFQKYWSYGALDPVLTCRIYDIIWPQVQQDALKAYELENAALWPVFNMERYGAHVDKAYAAEQLTRFTEICDEMRVRIREEWNLAPGSNPLIIAKLQELTGFHFTERTKSGALALTKEVLQLIDHPLAEAVLTYRQHQKMASTYLSHFVHDLDENDLLHPDINTLGARTGRMSMSGPNLQNLPRRNENRPEATAIRNCITTRYEDGALLMCDFDQIEMRCLAHVSGDPGMIAAFKDTSTDFFVTLGRVIFNDPDMVKSDKRRQLVKNGGYAKIYGAGLAKFAATAKVSTDVARSFLARFDEMFPGGRTLANTVQRVAMERAVSDGQPFVRSPLTGRKQIADSGKEYALTNYMLQGVAAEILKMKILELDAAGLGQWMVAPVHDEIILDVPGEHLDEAVAVLRKVMNDDSLLSVPVSASVSYGKRWGEKMAWPGENE